MKNQIDLDTVIVEDDLLVVIGSSTSFVNEHRLIKADPNLMIEKIRAVAKRAKTRNVKLLRKNTTFKTINEHALNYNKEFEKYNTLFDTLKTLVENKLQKGIFTPTSEDVELKEISKIRNQMSAMLHRNTSLSIIDTIDYRIDEMLTILDRESNLISLGF